jgi:long-chain fatty acid transport protein
MPCTEIWLFDYTLSGRIMKTHNLKFVSFALALASVSGTGHASGFAIAEQNASGMGNAYAGQAASAQDASTVFSNPAGMTQLSNTQLVVAGSLIDFSAEFSGTFSTAVGGGQGGDAGSLSFVPSIYVAYPISNDLKVGLGINSPFGLKTEYDADWVGRYQAIKSDVKTININPSIAWRANDQFSIGGGLDFDYIEATLSNAISPLASNSMMTVKAKDKIGVGFNLGVLWFVNNSTRAGLTYRSKIDHKLDGTLTANAVLPSGDVSADITLPDTASLSVFHKLSTTIDLLADVSWTGWSSFDKLAIAYTSILAPLPPTQENWKDTWRYSLGANYHFNNKWILRGGLAFDQNPVPDAQHRTARIPDGDRTWVAAGGQYRISNQDAIDFGYVHVFIKSSDINNTNTVGTLTGSYESHVDLLSAQYTHSF